MKGASDTNQDESAACTTSPVPSRPPPQLIMDDGSRIFQQQLEEPSTTTSHNYPAAVAKQPSPRSPADVRTYYELDRMIQTVIRLQDRVAVQLPNHLLRDAATICHILETESNADVVFVVPGGCCCSPHVRHGNATVVLHYGHACFSSTTLNTNSIRMAYGFGSSSSSSSSSSGAAPDRCCSSTAVHDLLDVVQVQQVRRILLFYSLDYHEQVEELSTSLSEQGEVLVITAEIPSAEETAGSGDTATTTPCGSSSCCTEQRSTAAESPETKQDNDENLPDLRHEVVKTVGGLRIPASALDQDQGDYALLFLGDDSSRQYLNIAMRFLSSERPPAHWWTYHNNTLQTELSSSFHRLLRRRFYLVQKAKVCRVFGLLTASPTATARTMVQRLRRLLTSKQGITAYTFVISAINPAKLANFGVVDCFVLIACPEHSLLHDEREAYPVPVITPFELLVAFDVIPWHSYSTNPNEYWPQQRVGDAADTTPTNASGPDDDDDDDAPQFSLVSGSYQAAVPTARADRDLSVLPGQGRLTQFTSAGATHLQQRTYQGLDTATAPPAVVQPAIAGQTGIASKYQGDR